MRQSTNKHEDAPAPAAAQPLELMYAPLKCVWSGFPSHGCSCRSRIPASVVMRAWQREVRLEGAEEGFFQFSWRSGVWLAYGLADGGVRGVFCPTHCAEHAGRRPTEPTGDQRGPPERAGHAD